MNNNFPVLPLQYQNHLEELMPELTWVWHTNTSYHENGPGFQHLQRIKQYDKNIVDNGQFTHPVLDDGQVFSQHIGLFIPVLYFFAERAGMQVNKILRLRVNMMMQDKKFTSEMYNYPHVDIQESNVFLYYVNDSDGDTVLFNEFDNGQGMPDNFTVFKRNKPEKGSGIFFEGSRYHASCSPTNTLARFAINFNFI